MSRRRMFVLQTIVHYNADSLLHGFFERPFHPDHNAFREHLYDEPHDIDRCFYVKNDSFL